MQTDAPIDMETLPECDVSRRFVRVLKRRSNGFIEFEFSIGWPELSVELMLPERDFEDFCATQKALRLHGDSPSQPIDV